MRLLSNSFLAAFLLLASTPGFFSWLAHSPQKASFCCCGKSGQCGCSHGGESMSGHGGHAAASQAIAEKSSKIVISLPPWKIPAGAATLDAGECENHKTGLSAAGVAWHLFLPYKLARFDGAARARPAVSVRESAAPAIPDSPPPEKA
jgi:hypothetical protein